jgi:CRISPR-associated protein Csy1
MSEAEKSFKTWEDVITNFLKGKRDAEEEKYLKEGIKRIGQLYEKVDYFNNNEIDFIFDTRKNKKSKNESALAFQRGRAIRIVKLDLKPEGLNPFEEKENYKKCMKSLTVKYKIKNWLSTNCENASNVSFATHVIKLTHSKINTQSLFDCIDEYNNSYLTTSALKNKIVDGAVKGNQFAPIFQFLEIELNGIKLAEQLSKDSRLLEGFVSDDKEGKELLNKWNQGFRKALDGGEPSTHFLAKQIYFPLIGNEFYTPNESPEYHLLCNIVSSSLAHAVYERVFDDKQKPVKKTVEAGKFSRDLRIKFLQRSQLNVTASNHSNASQLNGKRGGKLHLFSTQPPTWQSQLKAPATRQSLFSNLYNTTIKTEIDYLRDFLMRFNNLDLSIRDPKRNRHLERWVNNIIDEFLFYVATIQNLSPGWSDMEEIKLKKEHQYLLDPYRKDEAFQLARHNTDWQAVIRADFAQWLNRQLRGKNKTFTPKQEHTRLWRNLLVQPLREYVELIEQEIKQKTGEII